MVRIAYLGNVGSSHDIEPLATHQLGDEVVGEIVLQRRDGSGLPDQHRTMRLRSGVVEKFVEEP